MSVQTESVEAKPDLTNQEVVHGVCRCCGHRRLLFRETRVCWPRSKPHPLFKNVEVRSVACDHAALRRSNRNVDFSQASKALEEFIEELNTTVLSVGDPK